MKIKLRFLAFAIAFAWIVQIVASPSGYAATELSDGSYKIEYLITQAQNDSVSMANDYFEKPAVLQVKNGEVTAEIQLNHSKWITVFKTAQGSDYPDAAVVKSDKDKDTRVVRFKIEDLSKPLLSKIHVTVPDIDYDHDYTIRFVFDQKTLKNTASSEGSAKANDKAASGITAGQTSPGQTASAKATAGAARLEPQKQVANPHTGDESPIALLAGTLFVSGAVIALLFRNRRRLRHANRN